MHAHPAPQAGMTADATASSSPAPDADAPLVVVGAGLAGWTTVREFRKLNTTRPVLVVTADSGDFYAKPGLSNALAQQRGPVQLVSTRAAKMAETLNVTLLAHSRVEQLDTAERRLTVRCDGASRTLVYSQLVLATGAQPIRSAIAGNAAQQVLSVNSLEDFALFHAKLTAPAPVTAPAPAPVSGPVPLSASVPDTLRVDAPEAPAERKTVLVIGAGLIGCEFANDLLQAGHAVHVVDPSPRPLAALLPEAAGLQLQQALTDIGAHWHFGTTVQAVDVVDAVDTVNALDDREPVGAADRLPVRPPVAAAVLADDDAARALRVTLADGSRIPVDAVLSAIGLRADTALALAAGLTCERGIVVDSLLQTSAAPVYALGDAAQYASAGQRTLPFVMPIMNAAKALAATLNGTPTALVFPLMPVSIKTPALPLVVSAAHPALAGSWVAESTGEPGTWRFLDMVGVQRGFALSGKHTARRMELSKQTVL